MHGYKCWYILVFVLILERLCGINIDISSIGTVITIDISISICIITGICVGSSSIGISISVFVLVAQADA